MKRISLWLTCLLLSVHYPARTTVPDDDLAAQQMTVRELMRLDADLALEHARSRLRQQRGGMNPPDVRGAQSQGGALKLIAIYGVGKKLLAEVMVSGQTHVYMRGKVWPIGMKANPSLYRLRGISGSCVHLELQDAGHTLCLNPGLWTAK